MKSHSSTFSSKKLRASFIAGFLIVAAEIFLMLFPQPITIMNAHPTLGDILNHFSDERSRQSNPTQIAIIGDSSGRFGVSPMEIEDILRVDCENVSRTMHYGFVGLYKASQIYLKNHPKCETIIVPLQWRVFTSDDDFRISANYLRKFLDAHQISHEMYNPKKFELPSQRYTADITRSLFYNHQQKYFGGKSFDQWHKLHQAGQGCMPLGHMFRFDKQKAEENYCQRIDKTHLKYLVEFSKWGEKSDVDLIFVLMPIPETIWDYLETIGWDQIIKEEMSEVLSQFPKERFLNSFFPIHKDDLFCDNVHLNVWGSEIFSQWLANELALRNNFHHSKSGLRR